MKVKLLKAFHGDSIHVRFKDEEGENRNILIDGGISKAYKLDKNAKGKSEAGELKSTIDEIRHKDEFIDLLIMTHIDDDHIAGILKWFDEDKDAHDLVKKVWFNSGGLIAERLGEKKENKDLEPEINPTGNTLTSVKQGIKFSEYLLEKDIWDRRVIEQGNNLSKFGLEFKILSPDKAALKKLLREWKKKDPKTKTASRKHDYSISLEEHIEKDDFEEDTSISNGSSIAFILSYNGGNLMFLGDSHPSVVMEGLKCFSYSATNPIEANFVKLSHHGSRGNTNKELLSYIDSDNFFISTNGDSHQHPHKQLLARLINSKETCNTYFNYQKRLNMIFSDEDKAKFRKFKAIHLSKEFEI